VVMMRTGRGCRPAEWRLTGRAPDNVLPTVEDVCGSHFADAETHKHNAQLPYG
jgi:hypothetical protein